MQKKHFRQEALKSGTNAAFTKFLADDGLVFRPNPINGKKFYTTAPRYEKAKLGAHIG
jgi:hypothetical protein